MIPYHFHLIWMGKHFPFLNRLAIESILQTNPGAKVTLHYLDPPNNEHWQKLASKVEFKEIDLDELLDGIPAKDSLRESLGKIAGGYPAGRSNLYRYLILHRFGGIYLDFDTITLKSFKPLLQHRAFIGEERVFRSNEARVRGELPIELLWTLPSFLLSWVLVRLNCRIGNFKLLNLVDQMLFPLWSGFKLNNAVLACEAGHEFFRRAIEWIPHRDPKIKFNLGPMLMNDIWNEGQFLGEMQRLKEDAFYQIPPSKTIRFFSAFQSTHFPTSFCVHYCSSNEKERAALLEKEAFLKDPEARDTLIQQLGFPFVKALQSAGEI